MKILYVEDEDIVRELVSMEIEAEFSCEIISVNCGNEAIEYLKKNSNIDLIISDYMMPDGNGDIVYKYILETNPKVPFILLSALKIEDLKEFQNFYQAHPGNGYIPKPVDSDNLIEIIKKAISHCSQEAIKNEYESEKDYSKIKLSRFSNFNKSICDVFIKLSDNKFVKIINKNDKYSESLLDKYNRKCKYFFILKKDFNDFYNNYTNNLSELFNDTSISNQERHELEISGLSIIHEQIKEIGINQDTINTMNTLSDSCITHLKKDRALKKIISDILMNQNFVYEHCLLTSYICGGISLEMQWNTPATLQKLSFACILHDIALDSEELIEKHDLTPNLIRNESSFVKEKVFRHPIKASQRVANIKNIPSDIDAIIISHHESPTGTGYPRKIQASSISPLACIFIIAEDFMGQIYNKKTSEVDFNAIIELFKQRYDYGNYRKPLQGLLNILKK